MELVPEIAAAVEREAEKRMEEGACDYEEVIEGAADDVLEYVDPNIAAAVREALGIGNPQDIHKQKG